MYEFGQLVKYNHCWFMDQIWILCFFLYLLNTIFVISFDQIMYTHSHKYLWITPKYVYRVYKLKHLHFVVHIIFNQKTHTQVFEHLDKIKMNYLHWYDKLLEIFNTHSWARKYEIMNEIADGTESMMAKQQTRLHIHVL